MKVLISLHNSKIIISERTLFYYTMASYIDQKKLDIAIDLINKLANGVNPLNGSILPDSDIVNNVHVSRCLFFVANLLDDVGKKKSTTAKQHDLEFQLTPELAAKVNITERTGIAMFVKEINKLIPENMKPLAAPKVTQWLVSAGYLEELERSDGHKYKTPTELGASIGLSSAWREGTQGQYLAIFYDAHAQRFILDNLFK